MQFNSSEEKIPAGNFQLLSMQFSFNLLIKFESFDQRSSKIFQNPFFQLSMLQKDPLQIRIH